MAEPTAQNPEGQGLAEVRDLIDGAIQDTRSLTFDLSPPVLYDMGFEAGLEWLADQAREQHGIRVAYRDDGQDKPLDEDVRVLLFRAARELLLNVVKHARASEARVSVCRDDGAVRIEIADDGVGFDASEVHHRANRSSGFGLFSIRERLDFLGGTFRIESRAGGGTRVTLAAPLKRDSAGVRGESA